MSREEIELLNVNEELIKNEKPNGFAIKKNKLLMMIKKLPSNIYKLTVLFLATVADFIPDFVRKVPLIGYGVDFIAGLGKNFVEQVASDEFFDKVICPLVGIVVDENNPAYTRGFFEFTHHKGDYFEISLAIKSIATFVMEHPALVLAGGAVVAGIAYKLVSGIVKGISRKVKYNKLNDKQKQIYQLLSQILKKARKIKKVDNGNILVKDLVITYNITDHLREYPQMLDQLSVILLKLKEAIEKKNDTKYEEYRVELENKVFAFDKEHGNLLNKEMNLIENPKSK